ncbi:hypothetical protein HOP50_07g48010 [Chloropicon primus]|nr:hypothetical protein HOP50_07g48010 [Chloropicon primus]
MSAERLNALRENLAKDELKLERQSFFMSVENSLNLVKAEKNLRLARKAKKVAEESSKRSRTSSAMLLGWSSTFAQQEATDAPSTSRDRTTEAMGIKQVIQDSLKTRRQAGPPRETFLSSSNSRESPPRTSFAERNVKATTPKPKEGETGEQEGSFERWLRLRSVMMKKDCLVSAERAKPSPLADPKATVESLFKSCAPGAPPSIFGSSSTSLERRSSRPPPQRPPQLYSQTKRHLQQILQQQILQQQNHAAAAKRPREEPQRPTSNQEDQNQRKRRTKAMMLSLLNEPQTYRLSDLLEENWPNQQEKKQQDAVVVERKGEGDPRPPVVKEAKQPVVVPEPKSQAHSQHELIELGMKSALDLAKSFSRSVLHHSSN